MSGRAAREPFSPKWLDAQLTRLLPDFPDVRLCVALSGGVDSTALLAALATHRRRHPVVRAVNIDHGLHANSRKWSAHCRSLASSLGVPLEVLAVEVSVAPGISVEAAAREARYTALARNLMPNEVLLTGHHEDDQLETVLLQLFRGSGLPGIAAMPELIRFAAGWLCRPLLRSTRAKLSTWAVANGYAWIEDDSNANESFDRNYLRRQVLPLIHRRWPGVGASVARSARHAAEGQQLLQGLAGADVERAADGDALQVTALRALPLPRRRNAVRYWIARSGATVPDTRRLDELCGPLLDARSDANPQVCWGKVCIKRESGRLAMLAPAPSRRIPAHATHLGEKPTRATYVGENPTLETQLGESADAVWLWRVVHTRELPDGGGKLELRPDPRGPLNLDALPDALLVGHRRGGERLRPRVGGPSRALKNLLQESHVAVTQRAHLPLIYSGERLVAVADLWCDASVQARSATPHRGRILWRR